MKIWNITASTVVATTIPSGYRPISALVFSGQYMSYSSNFYWTYITLGNDGSIQGGFFSISGDHYAANGWTSAYTSHPVTGTLTYVCA